MKKLLSLAIALLMIFSAFSAIFAYAQDTIKVLSVVNEEGSNVYTVTFSSPIHIFKTGWVWLRQANPEDGTDQRNVSDVKYVGENTVKKGNDVYSDVLELTFPEASANFSTTSYGLVFVEYFLDDTNKGQISEKVMCGPNGERLEGTYVSAGLDFCWIPTDKRDSANKYALHIQSLEKEITLSSAEYYGKKLTVTFSTEVRITAKSAFSIDGVTITSVQLVDPKIISLKKYSKQITLMLSDIPTEKELIIADEAVYGKSGRAMTGGSFTMEEFVPNYGEDISSKIESKKLYSFMNCDTGRMLTLDGVEEFRVYKEEGVNLYSLRSADGTKYLTVSNSGALSFSDEPYIFNIYLNNEYERYQLRTDDTTMLIRDNDEGTTDDAVLELSQASNIEISTGWYLTLHGDKLPMRVAMVGDSITNGCTPDGNEPKAGCRAKLSAELVEKYGRVVFVGSAVASHGADGSGGERSLLTDAFLYREEGHNGWVVTSHDGYAPANNYGIDTLRENLQTKYKPDVVCMMIGINDVNQLGHYNVVNNIKGLGDDFFGRWSTLVNDFLTDLPENGRMIIGTFTPWVSGGKLADGERAANGYIKQMNETFVSLVEEMAKTDARISWTSNFDYVYAVGAEGLSTDGIHLSAKGYSAMADSYYDAMCKVCDDVAVAYEGEDTFGASEETTNENKEPAKSLLDKKWLIPVAALIGVTAVVSVVVSVFKKKK